MKYYFIINPVSGTRRMRDRFLENLKNVNENFTLIETSAAGDAQKIARELCEREKNAGENLRIFACGGDGTVSQVINGAYGFSNVEIGAVPLGTGNDFVRNFCDSKRFLDIASYMHAPSRWCDLIKYRKRMNGNDSDGYCMNMFNIGLDCNIVEMTESVKKLPLISGSLAYLISVFVMMVKRKGANLKVTYPDGFIHRGQLMLISIANGCYCGGGIKGLPRAQTDDGFFDVSRVKYVTRREFLKLFPLYMKGVHLDNPKVMAKDIISYRHERKLSLEALDNTFKLCVDGEISECEKAEFTIVEKAFRFISPV